MTSNDPRTAGIVGIGLGKGCLIGLAMTVGFIVISGLTYLLIGPLGLEQRFRLLIAVGSGPIIGTVIVLVVALLLAGRSQDSIGSMDETTHRNTP